MLVDIQKNWKVLTFGYATAFIAKKIKELTKLEKFIICDFKTALPFSPASKFIEDPAQSINDFLKYSQAAQLQTLTGLQREFQINSCFVFSLQLLRLASDLKALRFPLIEKHVGRGPTHLGHKL